MKPVARQLLREHVADDDRNNQSQCDHPNDKNRSKKRVQTCDPRLRPFIEALADLLVRDLLDE